MQAVAEHGVRSPLKEAELTKAEIRALSKEVGLPTWDKPAMPCLASRIPYGLLVSLEKLSMIDRAEEVHVGGVPVRIVTAADLIAMKERAAADPARRRSKSLRDLADVALLRGDAPDPDEGW